MKIDGGKIFFGVMIAFVGVWAICVLATLFLFGLRLILMFSNQ